MPAVLSKPALDWNELKTGHNLVYNFKEKTAKVYVKRDGDEYMTESSDVDLITASALRRCFPDAVDIYRYIDVVSKNKKKLNIELDMRRVRTMCQHKGDTEENTVFVYLRGLLIGNGGWTINKFGYALNKRGQVEDDSFLILDLTR